ncbi:sugar ABC transporter substrate-binding protein [Microbacterium sp. CJ88]|uniref:sugar ABC transporter substrate-binding protein n=1 Tax=Microbacterium sp. CJ88 TaxID=3445672 RepID=UPI003F65BBA7
MTRSRLRRLLAAGAITAVGAIVLAGCGSGFSDPGASGSAASGDLTSSSDPLKLLIGSSGEAETTAVNAAVAAWSKQSGIQATVSVASDLPQELSQGFAAGSPPDLFYLAPEALAGYAGNGSLKAYGDMLGNKDDFYPSLVQNFTYQDQFYCAPKDFSTLQLVINKGLWDAAGLTDADLPTTWDQLATVAQKLTANGVVGLAFGAEYQRVGAFMAQAGGGLVSDDGKTATADSTGNVDALTYVKTHLAAGTFAYAKDVGAGWGGEAFGKGLAAMTIEGNWITGAMSADFPTVQYVVAPLPAGPSGQGTLQFTNCWGMAADSPNQKAALDLVQYLTSADQVLAFSKAFGPMPPVRSAAAQWTSENPALASFLKAADYAKSVPVNNGITAVIKDFNAQLESLKTGDPAQILKTAQTNVQAVVG